MAWPDAAADLAAKAASLSPYTVGSGSVTLAVGTNAFVGPVRSVRAETPPRAVFFQTARGLRPEPYVGNAADFARFQVEVTVRSEPGKRDEGDQLARGLLSKLHRAPPAGYVTALAYQSGPQYAGEDEERQHQFVFTIELWWKGAT